MTLARSHSTYPAHQRWRLKNQRRGLTADGKVRAPRGRMSPEQRRAANTVRMRERRKLNIRLGLKWNGRPRARRLLLGVFLERLAQAIARAFVFLPPECRAEFTALGKQMSAIRRRYGNRTVVVK